MKHDPAPAATTTEKAVTAAFVPTLRTLLGSVGIALLASCSSGKFNLNLDAPSPADDLVITSRARQAIFLDPAFSSSVFDVTAKSGILHLAGRVRNEAAIAHAAELAQGVPGVLAVRNDLEVGRP
mgnify:FL=1